MNFDVDAHVRRCVARGQELVTLKTGERVFIDAPCIPLCVALNALPGVATIGSCSGHGRSHFGLVILAESNDRLRPLLRVLRDLPAQKRMAFKWTLSLSLLLVHDRTSILLGRPRYRYHLHGPTGETAYQQADMIAEALTLYRRRKWRTYPSTEALRDLYRQAPR